VLTEKSAQGIDRQQMAEWLNKLKWNWWFTGTFRKDFRINSCERAFYKWFNTMVWVNDLQVTGFFWCLEFGKSYRRVAHCHAILYLPETEGSERLESWWKVWFTKYGRCLIEKYDNNLGVGFYLTKYIAKDFFGVGEWGVSYPENRIMVIPQLESFA